MLAPNKYLMLQKYASKVYSASMSETIVKLIQSRNGLRYTEQMMIERLAAFSPIQETPPSTAPDRVRSRLHVSPENFVNEELKTALLHLHSLLTNDEQWEKMLRICSNESSIAARVMEKIHQITVINVAIINRPSQKLFNRASSNAKLPEVSSTEENKDQDASVVESLIATITAFQELVKLSEESEKMNTGELAQTINLFQTSQIILTHLQSREWAKEFLKSEEAFLTEMTEFDFWKKLEAKKHFKLADLANTLSLIESYLGPTIKIEELIKNQQIDVTSSPELLKQSANLQHQILGELATFILLIKPQLGKKVSKP